MLVTSWGNRPQKHNRVQPLYWRDQAIPFSSDEKFLAYGQGRSYGDSCLNESGVLLQTGALDRFIQFDDQTGILTCEAGITLAEILKHIVPLGWFLPVVPGTQYVSLGGAIANDIHGKNHHKRGTFGCHVLSFELLRSNGEHITCSPKQNVELFNATIGGLGLTGLILTATIQLMPVQNALLDAEYIKFSHLEEFFDLAATSNDYEYTVAWIDCLAKKQHLGRGIFMRANHAAKTDKTIEINNKNWSMLLHLPNFVLNKYSIQLFNQYYYHKQQQKIKQQTEHFRPFFFPLDKIRNWNRIYGKRGLLQYQCVVPNSEGKAAMQQILEKISQANMGSFLSVLKTFGDIASPGLLSFPRAGVTLALDFPHTGEKTLGLFAELDKIVLQYGGRVYPAKDARMSSEAFQRGYPAWQKFIEFVDPQFSSSFWRRVVDYEK